MKIDCPDCGGVGYNLYMSDRSMVVKTRCQYCDGTGRDTREEIRRHVTSTYRRRRLSTVAKTLIVVAAIWVVWATWTIMKGA